MSLKEIEAAAETIRSHDKGHAKRRLAIVLGSGWGPVVDRLMKIEGELAYGDIPGFPVSTVEGHAGRLVWGRMAGVPVYCMQGRFHYYEGYSLEAVTLPMRVFSELGLQGVLLTNAAGGITEGFYPGGLMVIQDHINFMGDHPLRGPNMDSFGPRFPDMTAAYDPVLRECLRRAAMEAEVSLLDGIYLAVSGPSFETPAEIRMFQQLGADAVGMSTVPECIVARHSGLRVAGISCITNVAAHLGGVPLSHEDVARTARETIQKVTSLFSSALPILDKELQG
ncbi:MAG: purine-nucleoside phosphorylase [Puniceicoccaceae bacterium]